MQLTGDDMMNTRRFPRLQVQYAREVGPIYKWAIRDGWQTGRTTSHPEANREFNIHHRPRHFSHDLGWTPIIGESFGHGLLNIDDTEHAPYIGRCGIRRSPGRRWWATCRRCGG